MAGQIDRMAVTNARSSGMAPSERYHFSTRQRFDIQPGDERPTRVTPTPFSTSDWSLIGARNTPEHVSGPACSATPARAQLWNWSIVARAMARGELLKHSSAVNIHCRQLFDYIETASIVV
jgi:hypothetical protein